MIKMNGQALMVSWMKIQDVSKLLETSSQFSKFYGVLLWLPMWYLGLILQTRFWLEQANCSPSLYFAFYVKVCDSIHNQKKFRSQNDWAVIGSAN